MRAGPAPTTPARRPGPAVRGDLPALCADTVAVLAFVLLGRTSHREGGAVAGYAQTAWPFLVGAAAGWLALLVLARAGRPLPARAPAAGSVVLAATVTVGMALRRWVTDKGTPVSFLLVATVFLAAFLVGWRLLHRLRARRAGS